MSWEDDNNSLSYKNDPEAKVIMKKNKGHLEPQSVLVKEGDKKMLLGHSYDFMGHKFNPVNRCEFLPSSNVLVGDVMCNIFSTDINQEDSYTIHAFKTLWGVERVEIIMEMLPRPGHFTLGNHKYEATRIVNGMVAHFKMDVHTG